jgi:hypothetical protein
VLYVIKEILALRNSLSAAALLQFYHLRKIGPFPERMGFTVKFITSEMASPNFAEKINVIRIFLDHVMHRNQRCNESN